MGLLDVFWKRSLTEEEKAEKTRQELERKTSKATEEVVAAIGDIRIEDRQLAEFERISKTDETGVVSSMASLTRLTRGLYNILDAKGQRELGWLYRRAFVAWREGNQEMFDYCKANVIEFFAQTVTMMVPKDKPDVYTFPVMQKPGGNMPPQNSGIS